MKFITTKNAPRQLIFADVTVNQFFVKKDGRLYQKVTGDKANLIAREDGTPHSGFTDTITLGTPIERLCDIVTEIEF